MRRTLVRCALSSLVCILLVAPAVRSSAAAQRPDGTAARDAFARFRGLAGSWRSVSTKGWNEITTFEVIARDSVVMATTTFRDAPDRKMVTMFYMDGDSLVADHYCEARNQPHLVAASIEGTRVVFRFAGGGNLPDRDRGHMDQAVYEFSGADSVSSRWTWYQEGEERWLEQIEMTRLR